METRITVDPTICHGKPYIRGLRYPVENILQWLAAGMTIDDILADYENLERPSRALAANPLSMPTTYAATPSKLTLQSQHNALHYAFNA